VEPELIAAVEGLEPWDLSDIASCRVRSRELESQSTVELALGLDPAGVIVTHEILDSEEGSGITRIRVYRPRHKAAALRGALVMFHGGAFCMGDLETEHPRCLLYAQRCGIVVISVEYRLAPEHPYPAGLSDCYRALRWVTERADDLGVDPARIAVAGVSAGGALAAAAALMARDRSGPSIVGQMLLFPVLDSALETGSMRKGADALAWQSGPSRQMWAYYLGGATPSANGYAAPMLAASCRSLPPAFIAVADQDPLRDEALLYAMKLLEADVAVELHMYRETYHVFDMAAPTARVTQQALADQVRFLSAQLSDSHSIG
jgi:acetyl esterase/lipase